MSTEQSAANRTKVGPLQASTVGPVQMSAPTSSTAPRPDADLLRRRLRKPDPRADDRRPHPDRIYAPHTLPCSRARAACDHREGTAPARSTATRCRPWTAPSARELAESPYPSVLHASMGADCLLAPTRLSHKRNPSREAAARREQRAQGRHRLRLLLAVVAVAQRFAAVAVATLVAVVAQPVVCVSRAVGAAWRPGGGQGCLSGRCGGYLVLVELQ
jgi:hypothetical protein